MNTTHSLAPLTGVKVLDFSQLIAGPSAAAMLAGLGADVIKVERPGGEVSRHATSLPDTSPAFLAYNRGKRSIELDMGTPQGREVALRLIEDCDVLIQGFRPGVMESMGLGYDQVKDACPGLIYASLAGFGAEAEASSRPGVDSVIQAESGAMSVTGPAEGVPYRTGFQFIDAATGFALTQVVLAALLHRSQTGRGAHVETSLFEVGAYMQAILYADSSLRGAAVPRSGNAAPQLGAPQDLMPTSDGQHIMIAAYLPAHWDRLCAVLGSPAALVDDPRFRTNQGRTQHRKELSELLAAIFVTQSRDHWATVLTEAGIINGKVLSHFEVLSDPEARRNGYFQSYEEEGVGTYWLPEPPLRSNGWEKVALDRSPGIGEHTTEILEQLGLSSSDVAQSEGGSTRSVLT